MKLKIKLAKGKSASTPSSNKEVATSEAVVATVPKHDENQQPATFKAKHTSGLKYNLLRGRVADPAWCAAVLCGFRVSP